MNDSVHIEDFVVDYLQRRVGVNRPVSPQDDFASLGIDSLEAQKLLGALEEHLGRHLDASVLYQCTSLRDLARVAAGEAGSEDEEAGDELDEFERFVNPHLGARLRALGFDRRFVRAEGSRLTDDRGRSYLDFIACYGAVPFGHNPPAIWRALMTLREEAAPSLVQPSSLGPAGRLARRLIECAPPGLAHATFCNSGAEAAEIAIKMCRARTGRTAILTTDGSFHGKTLGALSATGNNFYQAPFGAPVRGFERIPFGDIGALEHALASHPEGFAAFMVEPIQGEGGVVEPPEGYLLAAQETCRRHGVPFVLDEIQTGLGRTGRLFAAEHFSLRPDALLVAKALGGGFVSIGACLATADLYSRKFGLRHSSTFGANGFACSVGLASLDLLTGPAGEELLGRVRELGAYLKGRLCEVAQRFPDLVAEVRGRGLLLGVRMHGGSRKQPPRDLLDVAATQGAVSALVASCMLNYCGVRVAPTLNGGQVLRFEPSLTVTRAECDVAVDALGTALDIVRRGRVGGVLRAVAQGQTASAPRPGEDEPEALQADFLPPIALLHDLHSAGARTNGEPEGHAPEVTCARPTRKFAFIAHPLALDDFRRFDASLRDFSEAELLDLESVAGTAIDPFIVEHVRVRSAHGELIEGDIVLVPQTARELMRNVHKPGEDPVSEAVALALDRGAQVIGLGGYTSIVSRGGLALRAEGAKLTTGNAYTVVSALEGVEHVLSHLGRCLEHCTVAVVGAAGAIGKGLVALLAERAGRLLLVGNPARDEASTAARMAGVIQAAAAHVLGSDGPRGPIASWIARSWKDASRLDAAAVARACAAAGQIMTTRFAGQVLPFADVVITTTSTPSALIDPAMLKRGAIVCDLSRPANVGPEVSAERPDVIVLEGGLVSTPSPLHLERLGLPPSTVFACMAETMLLAMEPGTSLSGVGTSVSPEQAYEMRRLARKHGFALGELRSHGRALELEPCSSPGIAPPNSGVRTHGRVLELPVAQAKRA